MRPILSGSLRLRAGTGGEAVSPWKSPAATAALAVIGAIAIIGAIASPAAAHAAQLVVPARARQLIVVSSPTRRPTPPGYLATLRAYTRTSADAPWHRVLGSWEAETGSGHLVPADRRREGDRATPIGVFALGARMYGVRPRPRGLHYPYHRLRCGDWWDEDPHTVNYNRFVHAPCGFTPAFASWSEALWTETRAYPYFAVIRFNVDPIRRGRAAPGSGIFLHSWVGTATAGCVAVHERELLRLLRWLRPTQHPAIEIGTDAQVLPAP